MMTLENRYNLSVSAAPYDSRAGFSGHSYAAWSEGTDYLFHRGEMEYHVRYADSANSSRKFIHRSGNALAGWCFDPAARDFQPVDWDDVPFDVQKAVNDIIKYEMLDSDSVNRTLEYIKQFGETTTPYWTVRGNKWEVRLEKHEDARDWCFEDFEMEALQHGVFTARTERFAEAVGTKAPAIGGRDRVSGGSPIDFAINYIAKEKGLEVKGIEKVKSFRFYLVNTNDGQYMAEFRGTEGEFALRMEPVMTASAAARKEYSKLQKAWDNQITRVSVLAGIPWKVSVQLAKCDVRSEEQAIEWAKRIREIAGTADAVDLHDLRKGGLVRKCNAISHMMNVRGLFVERLSAGEIGVLARYIAG